VGAGDLLRSIVVCGTYDLVVVLVKKNNLSIEQIRNFRIVLIAYIAGLAILAIIAQVRMMHGHMPFWIGLAILISEYLAFMVVVWLFWMENKMLLEGLTRLYLPEDDE
jgi:hypothetical protein